MVRRSAMASLALTLALIASRPVEAGAIRFTGDVERDFPLVAGNGVVAVIDNPNSLGQSDPGDVAQDPGLRGITGWNIKDLRLAYNGDTDTMYFGLNFFGIAGDADGDGNPNASSSTAGVDEPFLGGLETISVSIDTNNDGTPDVIAGVPVSKPNDAKGTDAFTVARYKKSPMGMGTTFGDPLAAHNGGLAYVPSAETPDFQFSIKDFTKLPGLSPTSTSFSISAFAGASADVVAGEDSLFNTRIAFPPSSGQEVPEPSTILAWTLGAGAAFAWRFRRRRTRVVG